jgi:TPR repeat protein
VNNSIISLSFSNQVSFGHKPSFLKALTLYNQACHKDSIPAQIMIGSANFYDHGIDKNLKKSIVHFRKASKKKSIASKIWIYSIAKRQNVGKLSKTDHAGSIFLFGLESFTEETRKSSCFLMRKSAEIGETYFSRLFLFCLQKTDFGLLLIDEYECYEKFFKNKRRK